MKIHGEYHRTRGVLGPFYIAALMDGPRMLNSGSALVLESVHETKTEGEAREWLTGELRRRGVEPIELRDTTSPSMGASVAPREGKKK